MKRLSVVSKLTTGCAFAVLTLAAAHPAQAQQTLYVSNNDGTIEQFTPNGTGSQFANTGNDPKGLAFDSAGNLYVANSGNNTIEKFNTTTSVGVTFASSGLSDPRGIAFDSAGNLYATNAASNTIEEFTPGGMASVFASIGLNDPRGVVFDSAGNLYAANRGTGSIEKFTPNGVGTVFASMGQGHIGLAFDRAGNLYAADTSANTIEKFTPGGVGSVFASTGLDSPGGLAFDSAGNLYAVNEGLSHSVMKFTPSGAGSVFTTALTGPTYLAFAPAPEPSTWAALAVGVLGLGGLKVRARRR